MARNTQRLIVVAMVNLEGPDTTSIRDHLVSSTGPDKGLHYPESWAKKELSVRLFRRSDCWSEEQLELPAGPNSRFSHDILEGEFVCSAVGDIDGDGQSEIVAGVTLASGLTHLVSFSRSHDSWNGSILTDLKNQDVNFIRSISTGDIDRDRLSEIALGTKPSGSVLLFSGSGRIKSQEVLDKDTYGTGTTNTREVLIADADNDGELEVLATNAYSPPLADSPETPSAKWDAKAGCLAMYKRSKTGWRKTLIDDFDNTSHSRMFRVGDIEGRGYNQILANIVGVYNPRDGTIDPPSYMKIYALRKGACHARIIDSLEGAVKSRGFDFGDVDRDGVNEIVAGTRSLDLPQYGESHLLCYHYDRSKEEWDKRIIDSTGEMGYHAVAVFDVDLDGQAEVVASDNENGVLKYYKLVDGKWVSEVIQKFDHRIFVVSIDPLDIAIGERLGGA